jgi:hypothetical protein
MEMIKRIAVAIALTFAPAAFAQTYIVPDGDCGAITVHVTRGTDFPNLGETIGVDRVKDAYVYPPKQRVVVTPAVGPRSLDFNANIPDDGVVMAAVDFTPAVSGNETRTEHAKAFIFCGAIAPRADWQRSTGLGLEIYPQGWNGPRPHMKPGDSMRFIAVDKATNKLIRDVPMELYRANAGRVGGGVPDQDGGMNFRYPEPGRYMVTTTYRRPDPQQPEHWLVDTSTLTFEIK